MFGLCCYLPARSTPRLQFDRFKIRPHSSQHLVGVHTLHSLNKVWPIVGPSSRTSAQLSNNIGSMPCARPASPAAPLIPSTCLQTTLPSPSRYCVSTRYATENCDKTESNLQACLLLNQITGRGGSRI